MKTLTFNELKSLLTELTTKFQPNNSYTGIFNITILVETTNEYFTFVFTNLKESDDICGLSLNHSYQPQERESSFEEIEFDDEDIDIIFNRDKFVSANYNEINRSILVVTNDWEAIIRY